MPKSCGCRPGYYLCPDGEHLWELASDLKGHALITGTRADWAAYDQIRAAYEDHIKQVKRKNPEATHA